MSSTIELKDIRGYWHASFTGDAARQVADLFGGHTIIATPYPATTNNRPKIRDIIQSKNPNCTVI